MKMSFTGMPWIVFAINILYEKPCLILTGKIYAYKTKLIMHCFYFECF